MEQPGLNRFKPGGKLRGRVTGWLKRIWGVSCVLVGVLLPAFGGTLSQTEQPVDQQQICLADDVPSEESDIVLRHFIHETSRCDLVLSALPFYVYLIVGALSLVGLSSLLFIWLLRKRVKRAVRAYVVQNKELQVALQVGGVIAWEFDIPARVFRVKSGAIYQLDGLSYEQALERVHPDNRTEFTELFEKIFAGEVDEFSLTTHFLKGEEAADFYVRSNLVVVRSETGAPLSVIGADKNITQQERQRIELEDACKSLDSALLDSEILVWDYDVQSEQYRIFYGDYTSPDHPGNHDIFRRLHPDDRAAYDTFIRAVMVPGGKSRDRMTVRLRQGESTTEYGYYEFAVSVERNKRGEAIRLYGTQKDITAIELDRQRIETISRKLQVILDAIPSAVEYYDRDGVLCEINKKELDIFGLKNRTGILTSHYRLADNPLLSEELKSRFYKGEPFVAYVDYDFDKVRELGYFETTRSGKAVLDVKMAPVINDGEVEGMVAIISDVTDTIALNQRYKELYAENRAILQALPIGVAVYDAAGKPLFVNQAQAQMYGVVGREPNLSAVKPLFCDSQLSEQTKERIRSGEEVRIEGEYDTGISTREGYFHADQPVKLFVRGKTKAIRNECGAIEKYILILEDNTQFMALTEAVKRSDEQKQLILNNTNSGYVFLTPEYRVLWENVSQRFDNDLRAIYVAGKTCYHGCGFSHPCEECPVPGALRTRKEQVQEMGLKDGSVMEVYVKPIVEREQLQGVVMRIDDITERKQILEALREAKNRAERSDRLKSAFLANMSHEIRTPLNAIVGFSQLLVNNQNPEQRAQFGEIIAMNNEQLLQLIGDILDLSKLEAGYVELDPEPFDFAEHFAELFKTMQQRLQEKNENGQVQLIEENPYRSCIVRLDWMRMTQVITNFVSNAIKFTHTGSITMGYRCEEQGLRIYVQDTGIGIPYKKQVKIFDRFEQVNSFAQGTGLGLAICKTIIDAKKGRIGVESEQGKGSTFWAWVPARCAVDLPWDEALEFTMPENDCLSVQSTRAVDAAISRAREHDEKEESPAREEEGLLRTPPESSPTELSSAAKEENLIKDTTMHTDQKIVELSVQNERALPPTELPRILVVEDNDSNFLLDAALLRGMVHLTRAVNGLEAVESVQHEHFDLILMDLKMPQMDGMEATRRIREFNTQIPIIALTAYAFDSDRTRAFESGCNGFLTKPIKRQQLFDVLRQYQVL